MLKAEVPNEVRLRARQIQVWIHPTLSLAIPDRDLPDLVKDINGIWEKIIEQCQVDDSVESSPNSPSKTKDFDTPIDQHAALISSILRVIAVACQTSSRTAVVFASAGQDSLLRRCINVLYDITQLFNPTAQLTFSETTSGSLKVKKICVRDFSPFVCFVGQLNDNVARLFSALRACLQVANDSLKAMAACIRPLLLLQQNTLPLPTSSVVHCVIHLHHSLARIPGFTSVICPPFTRKHDGAQKTVAECVGLSVMESLLSEVRVSILSLLQLWIWPINEDEKMWGSSVGYTEEESTQTKKDQEDRNDSGDEGDLKTNPITLSIKNSDINGVTKAILASCLDRPQYLLPGLALFSDILPSPLPVSLGQFPGGINEGMVSCLSRFACEISTNTRLNSREGGDNLMLERVLARLTECRDQFSDVVVLHGESIRTLLLMAIQSSSPQIHLLLSRVCCRLADMNAMCTSLALDAFIVLIQSSIRVVIHEKSKIQEDRDTGKPKFHTTLNDEEKQRESAWKEQYSVSIQEENKEQHVEYGVESSSSLFHVGVAEILASALCLDDLYILISRAISCLRDCCTAPTGRLHCLHSSLIKAINAFLYHVLSGVRSRVEAIAAENCLGFLGQMNSLSELGDTDFVETMAGDPLDIRLLLPTVEEVRSF